MKMMITKMFTKLSVSSFPSTTLFTLSQEREIERERKRKRESALSS